MCPLPKVFFFVLMVFVLSTWPLPSDQLKSESDLDMEGDFTKERQLQLHQNRRNEHISAVSSLSLFAELGPWRSLQEQEAIKGIIEDFLVNDDSAGYCDQMLPAVALHASGSFVITWEDRRDRNWDIYAQRYDSSGFPIGSSFRVNDDAGTSMQSLPSIAMDGAGNFVIIWEDNRHGDFHVYAQRYDSSGSPIGSNFMVSGETKGSWEFCPAIAMHSSGSFVVSWTDERDYQTLHWDIYARRYDSSGTPLGSKFRVNADQGYFYQSWSAVAVDGYGDFVVTWEDRRAGKFEVYAQRFDSFGSPVGSNFMVNDTSVASEAPAIAMDVIGNCVICWYDSRDGHRDIYAQRYDSAGTPIGSNFKVNDDIGSTWQMLPAISMHHSGSFIITWQDNRGVSRRDIYAQRYDSLGTPLGSNFKVNDNVENHLHWFPAIDMDDSGDFVIAWEDYRNAVGGPDIYAQRYDFPATALGSNFKVNDDVPAEQGSPDIGLDGFGNFAITWEDCRKDESDIYAQRYSSLGAIMGLNFKVNDDAGPSEQKSPAIALDGSGNFVITWEDYRFSEPDIFAQKYNFYGHPLGSNFKVNDDAGPSDQNSPAIALAGFGDFVVTWEDYRNGESDIYAQRYNSSGTPSGSNFKVNDDPGGAEQRCPAIAIDGSANFIITWEDPRDGDPDIYAQRYDPFGTPLGFNFKVNDDAGSSDQKFPAIALDSSGNFVISWEDYRNVEPDIYAQRYGSSGTPLGSNFRVNDDAGTAEQKRPAVAMEDSGNFIVTWEDYRNDSQGDIYAQRYDASGNASHINYLVPDSNYASFAQIRPAVAANSSNIYLAWQDKRRVLSWDIYTKMVDWLWPRIHGDTNGDGDIDVGDVVFLINYLYRDGLAPDPIETGDCNCNGVVDLGDLVYLITYLFRGGPPPC